MARAAGRNGAVVGGLALLALARPGCSTDEEPPVVDDALAATLADVWPHVIEPALADAESAADGLVAAAEAWAGDAQGEASRAAAQDAWRAALGAWQRVEVMQIGPIGSSLTAVGGADLRDGVYSWPTVNPCAVDQQTVAAEWDAPDFFETHLVNVYGFDALETTLFSAPGVNVCPSQVDINASGSWDALGTDGVQQNRADYSVALSRGIRDRLSEIRTAFDPAGGDFAGAIADGGQEGSPYETPDQALNALFDALFYLESRSKDDKLGGPLGLYDCGADSCLSYVESPLAGESHVWLRENLVGFRALYTGGEGTGIDDLLRALDHTDTADAMIAALDAADVAAAALTVPVDVAVAGDQTPALALHAALDVVGELLESEVAPALVLQIPAEAAGDND